jgi:hypothetical protein
MFKTLANGNPTFDSLWKILEYTWQKAYETLSIGIYVLLHQGIRDTGHGVNGIYTGKSMNLYERHSTHAT